MREREHIGVRRGYLVVVGGLIGLVSEAALPNCRTWEPVRKAMDCFKKTKTNEGFPLPLALIFFETGVDGPPFFVPVRHRLSWNPPRLSEICAVYTHARQLLHLTCGGSRPCVPRSMDAETLRKKPACVLRRDAWLTELRQREDRESLRPWLHKYGKFNTAYDERYGTVGIASSK